MLMLARKILWLCSLLLFAPHFANAGDTNYNLKGIKAISYATTVKETVGGDGCKIDNHYLNTSLEFVANQSTNLKITQFSLSELYSQTMDPSLSDAKRQAAGEAVSEIIHMPFLFMRIMPLQTQFACAGTIHATLSAHAKESPHLYGTDAAVWEVEIWSTTFGFVGPQQTFSNQAINLAEQIMKQLVNDWTASQ